MDKVVFYCTLKQLKVDGENEVRLTIVIPATDAKKVMEFYADNTEKLISAALVRTEED